jgi:hypothetical protein
MAVVAAIEPGRAIVTAACGALGLSRATYHRHRAATARPSPLRRRPARALAASEREIIIALLREPQ